MNNVFSHRRFFLLLQKDAADLRPKFIRLLLVSFGIGLLTLLLANYVMNEVHYDIFRLIVGVLVVTCVTLFAPFQFYKHFNHRTMGVSYFMLPASQFEKWLSMFFYCLIVTPVLSILALTLADLCMLPVYPWDGMTLWFLGDTAHTAFNQLGNLSISYLLIFGILGGQSLFFLCNTWFQESKVRKTFAVIIIIIIVNITLRSFFDESIVSKMLTINTGEDTFYLSITDELNNLRFWQTVRIILLVPIPIGLWYASFLKLKEQEL